MLPHSVVLLRIQGPLKLCWGKNHEQMSLPKHFLFNQYFTDCGADIRKDFCR